MTTGTGSADTVVVVGSAAGIGAATARRLALEGHRVITVDVRDADVTCDLGTEAGRRDAIARVTRMTHGVLDGLVHAPRAVPGKEASRAAAGVVSLHYFGSVAVLEGLRPALARSGHAAVVVSTMWTGGPPRWPGALERLCLAGDESRALKLADAIGPVLAYRASTAALTRYVRRHALTPGWSGAAIRLNTIVPGIVDPLPLGDDLNDDRALRDLEGFRVMVESVAARIVFLLGAEARAFWRLAFDDGPTPATAPEPAGSRTVVETHSGGRR
jgi:NAD(P)-dependent dehydrogenase (short-subunit alcohol dehydrogenase family)